MFGAHFLLMRDVERLEPSPGRFRATVSGVGEVTARAVVLATGVSYRRLDVPELAALTDAGVFYGASISAAHGLAGLHAVVVGGGNSAGQAVLHLAHYCKGVTLVVRGSDLARGMSSYLIKAIEAAPGVRVGAEVVGGGGDGRLEWVTVRDGRSGDEDRITASGLFIMIGALPRTDWLPEVVDRDGFGFVLAGADAGASQAWPLERPPYPYETTVPGLFAVGDVRSGSVKRVAPAVGEGSVAISQLHQFLAVDVG